jgi:hypothetical protein
MWLDEKGGNCREERNKTIRQCDRCLQQQSQLKWTYTWDTKHARAEMRRGKRPRVCDGATNYRNRWVNAKIDKQRQHAVCGVGHHPGCMPTTQSKYEIEGLVDDCRANGCGGWRRRMDEHILNKGYRRRTLTNAVRSTEATSRQ